MKKVIKYTLRVLWSLLCIADAIGAIYCSYSRPFRVIEIVLTVIMVLGIYCVWYVINECIDDIKC